MKILFATLCLIFPFVALAQKKLPYDLYSPDTMKYDVKVSSDASGTKTVHVDFGTFNFTDEPEINFYVRPQTHPFILDKSLWNVAYLKPVYDKRYMVLSGNEGKIISFQYISKYNKFFKSPFKEITSANTTHGKIFFEFTGEYLPKYIYINTLFTYHTDAVAGKEISDTFIVKNKGLQVLKMKFLKYDEGLQNKDSSTSLVTILPGKEKKVILCYTPLKKGSFNKAAEMMFYMQGEKVKHNAIIKMKGHVAG